MRDRDFESRIPNPPAQIEIFDVQEIALVESADRVENPARHKHARAGNGFDGFDRRG